MKPKLLAFLIIPFVILVTSCGNGNKPKPVSKDITKTAVTVNGKKDSVINNPAKNYTKVATVPDPCVRCMIETVQKTPQFKRLNISASSKDTKYIINWVEGQILADTASHTHTTNALKLNMVNKNSENAGLPYFLYDNSASKLYEVLNGAKNEIEVDKNDIQRIRNGCYWGVASAK